MANLYVYLLPAILHAVYACVPLTPPRPRPTPKPPGATGEVPATTTTTETTTTTVEACSGTPDNSTVTEDGNRCVFPFKDGDILHTSCVDYKGKYDWCATSLKSDCSFDTWSKCLETTSKPEEKCLTEEVNSGKECLFPFMFEGKEHLECLPYKGKFWCGLTYEYDKQRWGYCTQALCPPTKVEATEVPVTTQGPTEVPATSQEPETTTTTTTEVTTPLDWEETQTTVDIAVDGSFYSCNIDFKMTTDQGVKYKDVTSSCSGSSKTDDMIDKLGVQRFTLTMQSGIGLYCQVGAALLPQSLTLSVEVMENTLKCEPLDSQCITIGGNNFPDNCVFPYNYQGRHYKACTDSSKDPSKLWCPTVVTASGEAEKDSWGFCSPSCGYCAGSPIARGAPNSQPCGFDCVLNPAKKKAGLDQATMSFNSPIQDKAKVVGGQYKFDFGSQTITISCPEKFHHPDLKGEKMVIASCGPAQHRYTVKNKDGVTLGTEIEKDFFGCDPCPQSMTYVKGSLESSDFKTSGLFTNIASAGLCHSECLKRSLCNSFKFSKKDQNCELIQDVVDTVSSPTPSPPDCIICTKSGPIGGACSIANRKQGRCKDTCSTAIHTGLLCEGVCNYIEDKCEPLTGSGTCLNNNVVIADRPPLLDSSKGAIFKLALQKVWGVDSERNLRCDLPLNLAAPVAATLPIDPHSLPKVPQQTPETSETKLARASVEILDAMVWLSDLTLEQKQNCQLMLGHTISIAQMVNDEIYVAGNLDFKGARQSKSTWTTFKEDEPGVKLAILYILKKWGFRTDQVFILKLKSHFMLRHAEMQLVRFANENSKTIKAFSVSKPPCCLCDKTLTGKGTYGLANTGRNDMDVLSGPGLGRCDTAPKAPTTPNARWCGHQYGAYKGQQSDKNWRDPDGLEWKNNQVDVIQII